MEAEQKRWEVYSSVLASTGIRLVYSKHATTASYDLERKIVFLPVWECLDDTATQALASHEIGHAKHSDFALDDFREFTKRYGDLFNVVEDARIERLMKQEFPGLNAIFRDGYRTLADNRIFPLEGIETASLVERLNAFAKFGFMVNVPFPSKEEAQFSYRLMCLSTKTDVIDLCEDILDYLKKLPERSEEGRPEADGNQFREESGEESCGEDGCGKQDENGKENRDGSAEDDGKDENGKENRDGSAGKDGEDESRLLKKELTDTRTRTMERELHSRNRSLERENRSSAILVINSKKMVESVEKEIGVETLKTWQYDKHGGERRAMEALAEKAAQAAASLFSQKKSAMENASRSKRIIGRIDTRRLAKYAVSDAIFRQMENVAQGKSHGVSLLVDFSGSMSNGDGGSLKCACMQAAILGRFCQMCRIPFSIYAFGIAADSVTGWDAEDGKSILKIGSPEWFDPKFIIALAFGKRILRGVHIHTPNSILNLASGLGTPTFEAVMVARRDILKMRAQGVEKPVLIVVTDGAHNDVLSSDGDTGAGTYQINGIPAKIVIDGKAFSIDEAKSGFDRLRADKTGKWAFEMLLGHLKKETGASVVFSGMGSDYFLKRDFERWVIAEKYYAKNGMMHGCGVVNFEPYIFRRAFLCGEKIEDGSAWKGFLEKPFIEAQFKGDRLFSQFLLMNTTELHWIANDAKKIGNKKDADSVLGWMRASNKQLAAYKALACAFIRFFS